MSCINETFIPPRNTGLTSESGLYSDDFNVTLEMLDAYADVMAEDGPTLWKRAIEMSKHNIANSLRSHLGANWSTRSMVDNFTAGLPYEKYTPQAATNRMVGIEYNISSPTYGAITISQVRLALVQDAEVPVFLYDTATGEVLEQTTVSAKANQVVAVNVNWKVPAVQQRKRLAIIYYDEIGSIKTGVYGGGCMGCRTKEYRSVNAYSAVRGISYEKDAAVIVANATGEGDTGGLGVNISFSCDLEAFVCFNRELLKTAIGYGAAQLAFEYGINATSRLNSAVGLDDLTTNREWALEKLNEALRSILPAVNGLNDGYCLSCKQRVKHIVSLP